MLLPTQFNLVILPVILILLLLALSLNSGTIKDVPVMMQLLLWQHLGTGSLGANNALIIDTTAPSIPVLSATNATSDTTPILQEVQRLEVL